MNRIKLIGYGLSMFVLGAFAVVSDEIQSLLWNDFYNFPIIGLYPKFGSRGQLGAWDIAFGCMLIAFISAMILYGDLVK